MAALGLQRVGRKLKMTFDTLTYMSVIVPEIVIALATLVLFATSFDFLKSTFGMKLNFGYPTIIAAHVLFNLSLVLLLVRARLSGMDRSLTEASADLFATPWRTFRQITFPQLLPAIVAGFLLSFTFSFDDFVITTFTSGPGSSTLPLFIFGQVRRGVTPETNAVATMMLGLTLLLLLVGQMILVWQARRRQRRRRGRGVGGDGRECDRGTSRRSVRTGPTWHDRRRQPRRAPRRAVSPRRRAPARAARRRRPGRRPCRSAPTAGPGPRGRSGHTRRSGGRSDGGGRGPR